RLTAAELGSRAAGPRAIEGPGSFFSILSSDRIYYSKNAPRGSFRLHGRLRRRRQLTGDVIERERLHVRHVAQRPVRQERQAAAEVRVEHHAGRGHWGDSRTPSPPGGPRPGGR